MAKPEVAPPPSLESESVATPLAENDQLPQNGLPNTDHIGVDKQKPSESPKHLHNLLDMPPELQANILKHMHRLRDLKSVCLTSRRLYDVAVPELYHTMELRLGEHEDIMLSALLKPENKGLKYIRVLRMHSAARGVDSPNSNKPHLQAVVRMVIDFLPENILEDFEWSPWLPLNQDTLLLLIRNQQRLRRLSAFRLYGNNVIEEMEKRPDDYAEVFKNCNTVTIRPESLQTLQLGHYFLTKISDLTELALCANFARNGSHHSPRDLNDGPIGPGLITRTLFRHFMPFDSNKLHHPFANLKTLSLGRIGLRHCADTYGCFVDFTKIECLHIMRCPGADALLSLLCKSSHLPRRLRVFEFQHDDNSDQDALTALDDFLCLVEGIEDLYIDLNGVKALPSTDGICKHGKTLGTLLVHASEQSMQEEHVWPSDEFQRICSTTSKVQQLSCAWPSTSVLKPASPDWVSYHLSIRHLPRLVTLHISTFPDCSPLTVNLDKSIYAQLLRGSATQLLSSAKVDSQIRLGVVAFGVPDTMTTSQQDSSSSSSSNEQSIFIRSKLINADHKEEITAVPIGGIFDWYGVPHNRILKFDFRRGAKMPVREYAPGWGDDEEDLL